MLGRPLGGTSSSPNHKRTLYLIGGGVGVVAVWYMLQRRKAAAAVDATTDPTVTEDTGTDSNGLDTGSSPALTSYTDPSTGAIISGGGWNAGVNSNPTGQTITAPTTNAQWTQQAIAYLVQNGFDPITVSVALGKYMANQNLTNDELVVVESAISAEGQPPVSVPPPHLAPPSGQTATASVTHSVTKPKTPTGLHVASHKKNEAVLVWDAQVGANEYRLHFNGIPVRTVPHATTTVHRNGKWAVASVRGSYTSKYTAPVVVKGI